MRLQDQVPEGFRGWEVGVQVGACPVQPPTRSVFEPGSKLGDYGVGDVAAGGELPQ
jgi:hypothetical protein